MVKVKMESVKEECLDAGEGAVAVAGGKKKEKARPESRTQVWRGESAGLHGAAREEATATSNFINRQPAAASCEDVEDATADRRETAGTRWAVKKHKAARPDARTEFLGVSRQEGGRYGAQISGSKGRIRQWLGAFATAEEAARAYDAAAVRLHGAAAKTNFSLLPPTAAAAAAADDDGVVVAPLRPAGSVTMMTVRKKAAARPDARTQFRGVHRQRSGKYAAQIWDSMARIGPWLGSFHTAEAAARAYDAAAVKLRGAAAKTNFKQPAAAPTADDIALRCAHETALKQAPVAGKAVVSKSKVRAGRKTAAARTTTNSASGFRGVYRSGRKYAARIGNHGRRNRLWLGTFGTAEEAARAYDAAAVRLHGAAARTNFSQPPAATTADDGEEPSSSMDLLNGFPDVPPALDFLSDCIIPAGSQLDDLWPDSPPAEWQQLDEFLKDMDFTEVVAS